MSNEHLSIILETTAFFLVTVDLYGKQRLEHLHKKIKDLSLNEVHYNVSQAFIFKLLMSLFILPVIYGAMFSPAIILGIMLKYNVGNLKNAEHTVIGIIVLYCFLFTAFLGLLTRRASMKSLFRKLFGKVSIGAAYFFRNILMYNLIKFPIALTRLFPLEGIMIFLGTLFFVASKILAYTST